MGVLELNLDTGRVQLTDQTGAIDCITAQQADVIQKHDCIELCLHPNTSKASHCTNTVQCPYLQTWALGAVVRIDR